MSHWAGFKCFNVGDPGSESYAQGLVESVQSVNRSMTGWLDPLLPPGDGSSRVLGEGAQRGHGGPYRQTAGSAHRGTHTGVITTLLLRHFTSTAAAQVSGKNVVLTTRKIRNTKTLLFWRAYLTTHRLLHWHDNEYKCIYVYQMQQVLEIRTRLWNLHFRVKIFAGTIHVIIFFCVQVWELIEGPLARLWNILTFPSC